MPFDSRLENPPGIPAPTYVRVEYDRGTDSVLRIVPPERPIPVEQTTDLELALPEPGIRAPFDETAKKGWLGSFPGNVCLLMRSHLADEVREDSEMLPMLRY